MTKIDKASGVKTTPTAKKGKKIDVPKKFNPSDEAVNNMIVSNMALLDDEIALLKSDNIKLKREIERLEGVSMNDARKIKQLYGKIDMLKDTIIDITKSFCCIK